MIFIDTSVLVAAIVATEAHHAACDKLIDARNVGMFAHGLAEAFSTLTGGQRAFRFSSSLAAAVIGEDYAPLLSFTTLTAAETLRGMRGGAIFDYLHLVSARKAKAAKLYTLNVSNFRALHRAGDPEIVHP